MEKIKKHKKKTTIILIIVIILQLICKIYVDYTKEDFFIDETYSYGLMNNSQAFIFEREDFQNNWHTGEYFNDYITINSDEIFNLSAVYNNQVEDVHPPLYYLLLRIVASFTINNFTKWTGLILNLIIFVFCAIMVYKIGRNLLKNTNYSILLVIFYGFSLFSMQNTTYIRMYQLLELELLMLVYWHIKNFNKALTKKELLKLVILVVTGFLTHYYYVIFAVGIYIINMLQYIKEKQGKNILKYNLALIISAISIVIIFPACLSHIFEGYRGTDSIKKFIYMKSVKGIWYIARAYIRLIGTNMSNIIDIKYLAILTLVLIPIILIRKKKLNDKIMYLAVPVLVYLAVIVKSAPYIDLRYVMSIIVFIAILIIYILKNGVQALIKNRKIALIIVSIIVLVYSVPTLHNENYKYIYYGNNEKIEKVRELKDIPCIYIYNNVDMTLNNFVADISYLKMMKDVYILTDQTTDYYGTGIYYDMSISQYLDYFEEEIQGTKDIDINIDEILKDKDLSNGILIYSSMYNYKMMSYILEETGFEQIDEVVKANISNTEIYWLH